MAQFVLKIAHLAISIEPTLLLEKVLVAVSFPDYGPWEYSKLGRLLIINTKGISSKLFVI